MRPAIAQTATVVIATKNRKEELRRAVASSVVQHGKVDVLVIDDGSTDGTSEMVRAEFPSVRLERRKESRGYIARRNEGAKLAGGQVVFSIDDDAEFSSPDIIQTTLQEFNDPKIIAVAIPFVDVNRSSSVRQEAPSDEGLWLANEYIGTAHAILREAFNSLGGYCASFLHQGEEGDFSIRALDAGYFVRLGRAKPILHYESLKRSAERMNVYGQRNLMLFAWHNVPFPELLIHLPATVLKGGWWGLRHHCLLFRLRGTLEGMRYIFQERYRRKPVTRGCYKLYRYLKKNCPVEGTRLLRPE